MVNPNIQGVVPIDGVGYIAKLKRNYQPGEYRRLSNVELKNGIIKNRTNIKAVVAAGSTATPITNPFPFIGFIGQKIIIASKTEQFMTDGSSNYVALWSPTNLPVPVTAGSYHRLVGAFLYNKLNCWISHQYDANTGVNTLILHTIAENVLAGLTAVTYAGLTHTTILTDASWDFVFCNFFIQGERLWVTTNKGVFFSKPTDHTIWAVPNGGFFKFQGQNITYTTFNRDIIYVLCDNAVFSIAYATDPNEDAVARQLSDTMGGDHATIHGDVPYFVNNTGIFEINSSGVTKVMDSVFDMGSNSYTHKLTSFMNYLVITRFNHIHYDSSTSFGAAFFGNVGREFTEGSGFNLMGYNVFFMNTDTGAMHTVDFRDGWDSAKPGYIIDVIVNPNKDFYRNYNCFFLTNRYVSKVGSTYTYQGQVYTMSLDSNEPFIYDVVCNTAGVAHRHIPKIDVEIDSYTPDGNEYYTKKFRSIEFMGDFPSSDFKAKFAFDNLDYPVTGIDLNINTNTIEANGEPRTHYPCRVGLNQRARSISVRLQSTNHNVEQANNYVYNHFQISDIRVLWGYTKFGVAEKTPTTT